MTAPADRDAQKRAAALAAVAEIAPGMCVGLGTGTTAAHAVAALGARCREGLRITAVATSLATEAAARAAGVPLRDFAGVAAVDLCIDGVDEIDAAFRAIKGGGGAMLREKIVATAATRMIAIADASKQVRRIGAAPVPVEILPFARAFCIAAIERLGADVAVRGGTGAAFATDQGNPILDCRFGVIADPVGLAAHLCAIPGVLGHGLFLDEIDMLYVGTADGVVKAARPPAGRDDRSAGGGSMTELDRSTIVPAVGMPAGAHIAR